VANPATDVENGQTGVGQSPFPEKGKSLSIETECQIQRDPGRVPKGGLIKDGVQ
jgi:hypothetical protein